MNSLQDRIYREIIYYEDDVVQMENELAGKIDKLLAPYSGKLGGEQMGQLEAAVYEVALAAESGAFWLGVRYAPSLLGKMVTNIW